MEHDIIYVQLYKKYESEESMLDNVLHLVESAVVAEQITEASALREWLDIESDATIIQTVRELADAGRAELAELLGRWRQYLLLHPAARLEAINDIITYAEACINKIEESHRKSQERIARTSKKKTTIPFRLVDPTRFKVFSLDLFGL